MWKRGKINFLGQMGIWFSGVETKLNFVVIKQKNR